MCASWFGIRRKLAQIIWRGLQGCWNMETNVVPQHFEWHLRHWWARPAAPVNKLFKIGFHASWRFLFCTSHNENENRCVWSDVHPQAGNNVAVISLAGYLTASDQKHFHIVDSERAARITQGNCEPSLHSELIPTAKVLILFFLSV